MNNGSDRRLSDKAAMVIGVWSSEQFDPSEMRLAWYGYG